jgi:hypothetical protein
MGEERSLMAMATDHPPFTDHHSPSSATVRAVLHDAHRAWNESRET